MPSHSAHRPSRTDLAPLAQVVALGLAALAGAIASFGSLRSLAGQTGWSGWTSWLLPVLLDALAVAAWARWLTTGERDAMRWGLAATGASIAGNTASHLIAAGVLTPGWQIVSVVGAVPPIVVAAVVSLAGHPPCALPAEQPSPRESCDVTCDWPMWEREATVTEPDPPAEPATLLALTARTEVDADERLADAWGIALDLVKRARAAGVDSTRQVRATLSCSEGQARKVAAVLRGKAPEREVTASLTSVPA